MRIRLKHERLAALLAASRRSQNHWALRFGFSRGHLSDLVNGRHPYVSSRTRERLLGVLGVPFEELFEEEQEPRLASFEILREIERAGDKVVYLARDPRDGRETTVELVGPPIQRRRPAAIAAPAAPGPIAAPVAPRSSRQTLGAAMRSTLEDLRYALRISTRHRLAASAVIATMALGIAATTSVYSIVKAVLLAPLPFDDSDQVIKLGMTLRDGRVVNQNALPDLEDYRAATTIAAVTAVSLSGTTITSGDAPEHHLVAYVDHGYDDVFRLRPALGRYFQPDEYVFGAPRVVLLSHRLWQHRFGADPDIVGRTISLDHQTAKIVGVLPSMGYTFPFPDLGFISPLRPNPQSFHFNRGALWLRAAARMKPGVTLAQARAELGGVAAGIAARYPDSNEGLQINIERLKDAETRDARAMLVLLSLAVTAVLLVACVNVANLLLGHARARSREFAVRAALGGRSARIRRQILTESLTLSAAGGLIGLAVAPVLTRALVALYPGRLPRLEEIAFDWRVAMAGLAVTAGAGVIAGLPTARRAGRVDLTRDLRDGGRGASGGRGHVGRLLIASQVALSLALLFASGLLVQTFRALVTIDPGFEAAGVTTFSLVAPQARYRTAPEIDAYFARVDEALRALPGVADVATSSEMPYNGNSASDVFIMEERGDLKHDNPHVRLAMVSPSYWRLLNAPTRSGRTFTPDDGANAPRVAVVNDALADRYYPGQDPVGRRIQFNRETWQIVGVVASMRMSAIAAPAQPELYLPAAQNTRSGRYVLVRAAGTAPPPIADIRRAVNGVDATIAMTEVATLEDRTVEALAPERFRAILFSSLGLIAMVLSSLGIYSVLSEAVQRQRREIGIRMALGEAQGQVRRRVIVSALATVGIGAAAGTILAIAVGQSLEGLLVGVEAWHLPTFAATAGILGGVAVLAAYVPARRASLVDPLVALRLE